MRESEHARTHTAETGRFFPMLRLGGGGGGGAGEKVAAAHTTRLLIAFYNHAPSGLPSAPLVVRTISVTSGVASAASPEKSVTAESVFLPSCTCQAQH